MRVEMTFDPAKVAEIPGDFSMNDVYHTVKKMFAKRGLPCISEGEVLAFGDTGSEHDFARMWNVITALMVSSWFVGCASSCRFFDEDGYEDVLSQADLFDAYKKRWAI